MHKYIVFLLDGTIEIKEGNLEADPKWWEEGVIIYSTTGDSNGIHWFIWKDECWQPRKPDDIHKEIRTKVLLLI